MPWGAPAAQMRELVLAMRAIWANWYDGEPLRFEGKYYQHTLMTPAFTPEDTAYGAPKVVLAAVGPIMTEVAAEVGDGLIIHPFSNEKYIREVTLPAVEKGWQRLASSGRILKSATPLSLYLVRMNKPLMLKSDCESEDLVLRFDTCLQTGAWCAWLGRSSGRAERDVKAGTVERDGRPHYR